MRMKLMAPKAKTAEDFELGVYLDKPPTSFLAAYPDWLKEKVGIDPSSLDPETAFAEGVRLSMACHKPYQTSPENRERTAAARAARQEESDAREATRAEKQAAKEAREAEAAQKRQEREDAKAAKAAQKAEAKPAVKAAAPVAKKVPATKAAPVKKAPVRKGAAGKAGSEAPF